jgi:oxygen-independent coproporphyrinogen III oxidase
LPYIGIGPGAASYVQGRRFTNHTDINDYVQNICAGETAVDFSEELTGSEHLAETLMLMLRMRRGVNRQAFGRRFGAEWLQEFAQTFERYRQLGMVQITSHSISLTRQGLFVCNSLLAELVTQKATLPRLS